MSSSDLVNKIDIGRINNRLFADIYFDTAKVNVVSPLRLSHGEVVALVEQMADQAIQNYMEGLRKSLEE